MRQVTKQSDQSRSRRRMTVQFRNVYSIGNNGCRVFESEVANFVALLFAGRMNARSAANHFALERSPDDALLRREKGERRRRQHSPWRDDERLACKQGGAPGVHIGHEREAGIMIASAFGASSCNARARPDSRTTGTRAQSRAKQRPPSPLGAISHPSAPATESSCASAPALLSAWQSRGTV